jgi:DNA-binding CsgD family transcriptional regulator
MASPSEQSEHPPLFRRHVRRPRLTRVIEESPAQAVLLTGAAGFGKTTLAAEWAQGRQNVAWYRSTAGSADVAAFSVGIAEIVASIVPGAGERLKQRVRIAEAPEKAARPLAELLAQDLADWPEGAWLIVDDYHLVADSAAVEEFVDWLLMLTPRLRILVTTRRRPAWASARRILYGEVIEIRQEQLAMTNEEASQALEGRPTEAVRALVQQASGWPALIGLAALAASSELPPDRISDELFRYFAEEVLRKEPPDVQELMLRASLPASISVRTARVVLDIPDPEPHLDQLQAKGLLQASGLDTLRFHPLLREFLSRKLASDRPELVADLRARVLDEARGDARWEEAFDLAIQTRDLVTAAEILGEAGSDLLAAGRVETVEAWFDLCGSVALGNPSAALIHAESLIWRGRLAEAAALSRDLAQRLPADDARTARAWYLAGQATYLLCRYDQALDFHGLSRSHSGTAEALRDALWGLFISASELEDEKAAAYLAELTSLGAESLDHRLRLASGWVSVGLHTGSLTGVWSRIEPLLSQIQYASDPMIASSFAVEAAYVAAARGDYRRALELADSAETYCRDLAVTFAIGYCLASQTNAGIGLRRFRFARDRLEVLSRFLREHEEPFLDVQRDVLGLKLLLAEQGARAALARRPSVTTNDLLGAPWGELIGLRAVVAAAASDVGLATELSRRASAMTHGIEARYYSRLADLIVRVQAPDGTESLVSDMGHLIEEASHDEFLDAVVVAYRAYPPLLALLAQSTAVESTARQLLTMANDHALAKAAGIAISEHEVIADLSTLTKRENEVLVLLGAGLTNREISQTLFISLSTTKVHVGSIFRKLGVRTRLQAILRAQELRGESN